MRGSVFVLCVLRHCENIVVDPCIGHSLKVALVVNWSLIGRFQRCIVHHDGCVIPNEL